MLELVTIEEARLHLRLDADSDGGPDDGWLALFIPAVSEAVASWVKDSWRLYRPKLDSDGNPELGSDGNPQPLLDSDGDPMVSSLVRAAVLVELASQMRFREGEGENVMPPESGYGYVLSKGATALLTGLRRPTVS